jgi:hypothetical protein
MPTMSGERRPDTHTPWVRVISILVLVALVIGGVLVTSQVRSSTSNAQRVVPWANEPASSAYLTSLLLKPLPAPRPKTTAPACTIAQLSVASIRVPGTMQDDGVVVTLRNTSVDACLLRGTPRVTAAAPREATVVAAAEKMPAYDETADTAAGATVEVQLDAPVACVTDPGGANSGFAKYHNLTISIPRGGKKTVAGLNLTFQCGLFTTPFFTPKPAPTYPANPLAGLVPRLQLPATVQAGTTLHYVVDLVNPGNRRVRLSPCPAYIENSRVETKLEYRLNCQNGRSIPAHGQVRFEMEMAIPAMTTFGTMSVRWTLFGASSRFGDGHVRVN